MTAPSKLTLSILPRNRILLGDAIAMLRTLPSQSVDTVVTSPPYFLLRRYGVEGEFGQEPNIDAWVNDLVYVCDELARVLRPTGSLWLNVGDSYSRHDHYGAKPKSLLLGPERLLLALVEHGWIVRNKVVWAKPNPMPSSVRDRLNTTWEPLFLLVRSARPYFDLDAIREPHRTARRPISGGARHLKYAASKRPEWAGPLAGSNVGLMQARAEGRSGHPNGKNPGDVWRLATANYHGAHFATFPLRLVVRPIKATCPERVCQACGTPWQPDDDGLQPECRCNGSWQPGVVLDPFIGSGTVAIAAEQLRRDWLGIELSPTYCALAEQRIAAARGEVITNNEGRPA